MCGLVGFGGRLAPPASCRAFLLAASDSMRHRGPDDSGCELGDGWGLGFRRLSILDLSSRGHQPMASVNGDCWLVLNGEIYNFRELRADLESKGVRFRSSGDAEVLLELLRRDGAEGLERVNGMFALAFIDLRSRRLLLARDRLGVKPLVYHRTPERIVFASELAAVVAAPGCERETDTLALNQYLCFNYVPAPRTIFRGVRKLMPGHYLELDLDRPGDGAPRRYWSLRFEPCFERSPERWADEVEALLTDAVEKRLVSDVPVGTFLSGGVDSSLVTAMAARASRDVIAFTIGFREQAWDETPWARQVARANGLEHRTAVLDPDAWGVLPELVRHYQEPFADSSAVPTWYLCKAGAEHATVFLAGDGGDEAFAGYGRYSKIRKYRWLGRIPLPLRRAVARAAGGIGPHRPLRYRAARLALPEWERSFAQGVFAGDPINLMPLAPDARAGMEEITAFLVDEVRADADRLSPVTLMQRLDYALYLSNDILVKVDRASMAHSIEVRGPLLDYRVAELAAAIPEEVHFDAAGRGKRLLRDVAKRWLPAEVLEHRKHGFGVPLPVWFRGKGLDRVRDILESREARERGIYDPRGVASLLDWQAANARRDFSHALWRLLFLEEWYRQFASAPVSGAC